MMKNYYITARNPIVRAGVIRRLMEKGYSLYGDLTVSDYHACWPAHKLPVVIARNDGDFNNGPVIDLTYNIETFRRCISRTKANIQLVKVSPLSLHEIPDVKSNKESALVFPKAAKYSIGYRSVDGYYDSYTISNPVEETEDSITAYTFGRGIRTFKKAGIQNIVKVD